MSAPPLLTNDDDDGRRGSPRPRVQGPATMSEQLARRELGCRWDSLWMCRGCAPALAMSLEERMDGLTAACVHVDKAFCAAWADPQTVLVGTKCGSLLRVDAGSGAWTRLPLLPRVSDDAAGASAIPPTTSTLTLTHPPPAPSRALGVHAVALSPADDDGHTPQLVATAGAGHERGADVGLLLWSQRPAAAVATTAAVWPPPPPALPPLAGHADSVFGVAWLSGRALLSASRDGTVKAWRLPDDVFQQEDPGQQQQQPCAATSDAHGGGGGGGGSGGGTASASSTAPMPRVRDVRATGEPGRAVSVASDGGLATWDAGAGAGGLRLAAPVLRVPLLASAAAAASSAAAAAASNGPLQSPPPPPPPEISNLAARGSLAAVASRLGVTLVDLRVAGGGGSAAAAHLTPPPPATAAAVSPSPLFRAAPDPCWARSVCLRSSRSHHPAALPDTLSVGTVDGRLLLYDLRMASSSSSDGHALLPEAVGAAAGGNARLLAAHALSDGHLNRDHPNYRERFAPLLFPTSAHAHAWEPERWEAGRGGGGGVAAGAAIAPTTAARRVFVGGGPLPSGVRGCYMGVWM